MQPGTPLPDGYHFAPLDAERRRDLLDLDVWAFPSESDVDVLEKIPLPLTWSRTVGVVTDRPGLPIGDVPASGPELAAMHSSYPFSDFPVPGGTLPVAGLTWVGVHPAHRRRGILRAMIDLHFSRCRERGEAVSVLTAAEMAIYGRFGYGQASSDLRLTIPRGAKLRDVPGADRHTVRIERATRERHGALVADLHRRAGQDPTGAGGVLNRPGWTTRETPELDEAFWVDPPESRKGKEARRIIVVELDGVPRGYATFQRSMTWSATGPRGTVSASEVVALDAASARALWGVLVDFDLMSETEPFMIATDDPIVHLLVNSRAASPRVSDNMWARIVDVAPALAGRRYASDVDVVLDVSDTMLTDNAGTWRVRGEAFGEATCERTDAAPDLSLDVRELGSAYLGGVSLAALAASGLVVEHTPGALARASAAFGWPVAPVTSWVF